MQDNLVSICITTYNRKELLPLTLKSVLNQTYKNIEVIIVDDHSTDGTKELVENELLELDNRVRYIRHEDNKGLAAGRNSAIINSKGKYFTFCDDDDEWMPEFVEEFVNVAEKYDENWCFCCGGQYKNLLGTQIDMIPTYEGELKAYLQNGFTPPVASQFYIVSSLRRVNGYNENIKSGVDHDLWIQLSKSDVKIKCISKALSIPNANAKQERMTTNYDKRINGIKSSLLIWKDDLEEMYGKEFYLNFYNAYLQRERMKFLNSYLQEFNVGMAYRIKENISLISFCKMVLVVGAKKAAKVIVPSVFVKNKKTVGVKATLRI
ncbi:MAG: glycosyltransferase family 2 protein [Campylobacterota bacterium]